MKSFLHQGAITKRITAIEELAGMDILCTDKTGTLTLNRLTVDKDLIEARTHKCLISRAYQLYSSVAFMIF